MGAPRFVLDRFWPSNLFLGGIPGAWYDPTDLSTMFQDNTGLTPVTAVEQPVGLIFDKSQGTPVARYNLLTYSEDYANAAWTKTNVTLTSGQLAPDGTNTAFVLTGTAAYARIESTAVSYAAATYTLSVYVKKASGTMAIAFSNVGSSDEVAFDIGAGTVGTKGANVSSASVQDAGAWWRLVAVSTRTALSQPIRIFAGYPTNISPIVWGAQLQLGSTATTYQRITTGIGGEWTPGNHASQSTAASRPTYRARYNLLTYSEDFGNAAWSKTTIPCTITVDQTTAPDGTNTADLMTASATAFSGVVRVDARVSAVVTYTASCYFKAGNVTIGRLTLATSTLTNGIGCDFTLTGAGTAGVPATFGAGWVAGAATITSVGNGWYRCTLTGTAPATADLTTVVGHRGACSAGDTLFIWGAQVLTAADVNATGNAYQRIAAATVYDTAPIFRPYLAFDGVDDSLSTASIDFTSTDKMSVFSGVTKNSDATAYGLMAELSANSNTTNGTFSLWVPGDPALGGSFAVLLRGTGVGAYAPVPFPAPITVALTALYDIGAAALSAEVIPRVNRTVAQTTPGGLAGTGNFGNQPLFIGRRNNASNPLNGRLYSLIVRGAASSVTEIADTELWVNARTGAY